MSNELTLFPEMNMQEEGNIHRLPCYQGLSDESINRLETRVSNIKKIVNKASFDIAIELCEARKEYRHNKHGGFEGWVNQRCKFSVDTAEHIIQRYEAFGTPEYIRVLDKIAVTAQYQLSAPSTPSEAREEAIELAESGEKITVAKSNELIEKWKRIAEKREKEAKEAQTKVGIFQAHSQLAQAKVDELTRQIAELEEELRTVQTPEKVEVIPQATLDKITNLEALVQKLKEHSENLLKENKTLTDDLRKLREANDNRRRQEQYEAEIKVAWRKNTEALNKALSQFAISIPSPIAIQTFGADEWARYDEIEHTLMRSIETLTNAKNARFGNQFVESEVVTMPVFVDG